MAAETLFSPKRRNFASAKAYTMSKIHHGGRIGRLLYVILLAIVLLPSCREEDEPQPVVFDQTVIVFMPWSTNLYPFFRQNINDIERAINAGMLKQERILVCIANTRTQANLVELRLEQGRCVRDTLYAYSHPDFTRTADITRMLNDIRALSPTPRYSLIVGCHGMGWLPAGQAPRRAVPRNGEADVPMTRWFGGLSSDLQIEVSTLAEAIGAANMQMEYILFDDCYMSSVEAAYELRHVTDFLVASPTEIMAYGFPYHLCAPCLVGDIDFAGVCQRFYDFYSTYVWPYGTIAVTDCRQLEALAQSVRAIYRTQQFDEDELKNLQRMDGYSPTLFYDLGDYIDHLCKDAALLEDFHRQLSLTVPHKAHTDFYYSNTNGCNEIHAYSGLTTSEPSKNTQAEAMTETQWYRATHGTE